LLPSTLGAEAVISSALTDTGAEAPAVSTVLHWAGNSAIVKPPLRLDGVAGDGGRFAAAMAALFSFAYQLATSWSQPSSLPTGR
jgi:hypothetical protein